LSYECACLPLKLGAEKSLCDSFRITQCDECLLLGSPAANGKRKRAKISLGTFPERTGPPH